MRENREVPALEKGKKHGRKGALKGTDQRYTAAARTLGHRNARQMPTRQMNNRGGR
ncbi:hypothetical protein [Actinocorallia longicatena]|uniref:Uncharacterized protein n=1 Tax=Actinocorallia longicatena TaxID=111803 RepID=A0ABP6QP12_9ACTN